MQGKGKFERIKTQDNFATEKVDVIKNKMLGDYNAAGKYSIKEEIVNELLLMPKTQQNTFGSSIFASAQNSKFGNINFEILFKKSQKQNVFLAEYYVLEAVAKINGYVQNTQKTPLGSYKDFITDDFVGKALALFNVVNDGEGKEYANEEKDALHIAEDPLYIQNRKNIVSIIDKLTANKFNLAYKTYFTKRMLLLEQEHTPYSEAVIKTFHAQHDKIGKYFIDDNDKHKFKSLNELLDNCIDAVSGVKPEFAQDEKKFKEKQDLFTNAFAKEIEKYIDPAVRKAEKGKEKAINKIKEIYSTNELVLPADIVTEKALRENVVSNAEFALNNDDELSISARREGYDEAAHFNSEIYEKANRATFTTPTATQNVKDAHPKEKNKPASEESLEQLSEHERRLKNVAGSVEIKPVVNDDKKDRIKSEENTDQQDQGKSKDNSDVYASVEIASKNQTVKAEVKPKDAQIKSTHNLEIKEAQDVVLGAVGTASKLDVKKDVENLFGAKSNQQENMTKSHS